MGLRYATVTGVARDDLPDGGAWLYAETVRAIKELNPHDRRRAARSPTSTASPRGLPRSSSRARKCWRTTSKPCRASSSGSGPRSRYQRSLDVLTAARDAGLVTKSNLILGLGETPDEVRAALADLHDAGCDIVTITQYLRPSPRHHPVERWVRPEEFVELRAVRRGARLRRGAGRAAGAIVLPGRPAVRAGRARRDPRRIAASTRAYVFLVTMAKSRSAAENKAARAEAKAARKAASEERRSQLWQAFKMQRKEDKRLLPYMIGAFVLIVGISVAVGVLGRRAHHDHA